MPPPETDDTIPFPWQSIPMTVDNEARVLTIKPDACPKYSVELKKSLIALETNPTSIGWMKEDDALLTRIGDFMGQPLTTINHTFYAADTIRTEQFLDPTMPTWLRIAYPKLARYLVRYTDACHETPFMKRVRGGPMITQIVDNMMAIKDKREEGRKVLIFSAHDFTIHSLNVLLDVKSQVPQVASYADTIAVELHQILGQLQVKVFYMNNSGFPKYKKQVNPPECGTPCTLNSFNKITKKYFVRDFDGLCRV